MTVERPGSGSTVRRIILGTQLRRLREAAGLTRGEAGYAIRSSESKISRLELGRVSFKERDVADLLTLYAVNDEEQRELLLAMAREANSPGWWHRYGDVLPTWFQNYLGLEESASLIRTYEIQFVPGLLQTAAYARAIIRLGQPGASAAALDQRVGLRLQRQERLTGTGAPHLWAVIDEAALRRPIGGPEVMRGQIEHLVTQCGRPGTTIQVMPFRSGSHRAEAGAFSILRFPEREVPDVVYMENLTGALYLDRSDEVDRYLEVMEQLCVQSTTPESTPDALLEILREDYGLNAVVGAGPHLKMARTHARRLLPTSQTKGDFHAVVPTPFGTRMLVGDVLGAAGSAETATADVLEAFRQLAVNEESLPSVAERMNAALSSKMGLEEFVTAVLVTLHEEDERAEVICCGNPPPLLLRDNSALPLGSLPTYPPLSLLDLTGQWCEATTVPFRTNDRLLLFTHGASEVGQRQSYPLAERISALQAQNPAVILDGIQSDLLRHTGDEAALQTTFLLAHFDRLPARTAPGRTQPATATD